MSLFRNRQPIQPPKQTIQKDYDQGIDKEKFQKQILLVDATISQINQGFELHERVIKINKGEETSAMEIMRLRLMQKVNDFEQFLYDLEDPMLTINYIDAYLSVQDKIQQRMLFDSLLLKKIELPPPGSTVQKLGKPELYESFTKFKLDTGFETLEQIDIPEIMKPIPIDPNLKIRFQTQ